MSFAEQLAARAAEAQSHSHPPRKVPSSTKIINGTPPRPGKIIRGGTSSTLSSSPSTIFAEQLKKRSSSNRSMGSSEHATNNRHASSSSVVSSSNLPPASPLTRTPSGEDSSWTSQISQKSITQKRNKQRIRPTTVTTDSPGSKHILVPTCNTPNSNNDTLHDEESEEDDEYSSVGFSLTGTSIGETSTKDTDEHEKATRQSKSKKTRKKIQPVPVPSTVDRRGNNHIIPSEKHNRPLESPANTKEELQGGGTYPEQHQNNLELQSSKLLLQEQKLKSQTASQDKQQQQQQQVNSQDVNSIPSNKNAHIQQQQQQAEPEDSKAIFGAWAQIESLKRRVHEAEARAQQESVRAESASFELIQLVKEQQLEQQWQEEGGIDQASVSTMSKECDVVVAESEERATAVEPDDHEVITASRERSTLSGQEDAKEPQAGNTANNASSPEADESLQWKKRALEAEERFVKEMELLQRERAATSSSAGGTTTSSSVPSAAAAQSVLSNPNSHTTTEGGGGGVSGNNTTTTSRNSFEESELVRLKNAEIDVLRHQIHRLERRIQEECERNEDFLLRHSSLSSYHRHDSFHLHPLRGDSHPPLVVASECSLAGGSSYSRAPSDNNNMGESFRLLRSEIQSLQYQLRMKTTSSQRNDRGTGTYSTTGESTLSSLEGNDDDVGDEGRRRDGGDKDEEVVDGNDNSRSMWGLCCVRGARRRKGGYGRV